MAQVLVNDSSLSAIADAIREKLDVETTYLPSQMAGAIESIETGGTELTSEDEGKVVVESSGEYVLAAQTQLSISQNGTYDTTTNDEVVVSVSGGGGESVDWNQSWSMNWDFSDPVNTSGKSSYTDGSSYGYAINGWQLQNGILDIVNGGINLRRYSSGTGGYLMQRYKSSPTSDMVGKEFTLSLLVDNYLNSITFTMPSANSGTRAASSGGVNFRVYNYGTEVAVTIDISASMGSELIRAVKLERGSVQTLAHLVNGSYVLNGSLDKDFDRTSGSNGYSIVYY